MICSWKSVIRFWSLFGRVGNVILLGLDGGSCCWGDDIVGFPL